MAAAEARVVWQRTANRLQEDAKRAPKLACCQSSSATKQADPGPTADVPDRPAAGPTNLNRTPSYSKLSPDTRWWLHMQPNYGHRKGFTYDQVNSLENDDGNLKSCRGISESHKRKGDASDLDVSAGGNPGARNRAGIVEAVELEELDDGWEAIKPGCDDYSDAKRHREMSFDREFCLASSEKSEPWWRMADRDELVSLVARKSLDHVENCDLPPPQKMCHGRTRYGCSDNKEILGLSLDWKVQTATSSSGTATLQGFGNSGRTQEKTDLDETLRYKNTADTQQDCDGDLSKARLMEALCHSQIRAREAEKAAEKAYAEKEHIVTLFFRQASLLFAYKQWFRLLQLESLCLQFKSNSGDYSISTLFPIPWISSSDREKDETPTMQSFDDKDVDKKSRARRDRPGHDLSTTYAVAFALGLSLVSAGLLLGWTVGWMLPRF